MKELQRAFNYQGRQVRTILIDGEPWWVAKDVCDVLEIGDTRQAVERLDDDERYLIPVTDNLGRQQESWVVSEPGLYSLILGSRKPEAKSFKRWITHEVIPAIRTTGMYAAPMALEDLIIMQAKSVKELKARVSQIEERTIAAHHRIDNMDALDTIGDPQQRLNAMIRRYAQQEGLSFSRAWKDFRQAYNTAYRTNITMLVENYRMKTDRKKLTVPEYLAATGKLEDGIRVADKLLNQPEPACRG
ncbi:MAG: Bro-N domain-containing protein [Firmicutes bacterium]|nr:Bro-N domain-containing protein [Bacillota bacterium]